MNRRFLTFLLFGGLLGLAAGQTVTLLTEEPLAAESAPAMVNLPRAPQFLVRVVVAAPINKDGISPTQDNSTGGLIKNNLVLTNWHALRNQTGREVFVELADGNTVKAEVLKKDQGPDLALLRIPPVELQTLCLAAEEPAKGDTIVVTGFAKGNVLQAGQGEVVGRRSASKSGADILFVANFGTTSGMSGSPALNIQGQLVGTLFGSRDGYSNYAGIDTIRAFLEGTEYWEN